MTRARSSRVLFWRAFASLAALTVLAVLVVLAAPELARALRAWFAFEPGTRADGLAEALVAWAANGRVLGFVLLASLATHERWLVPVLDLAVGAFVTANVALVGLALGAYGPALLPWLVHVPLECAALAVALVGYLNARRLGPRPLVIVRAGALAAVLLALAAAVETWATPLPLP